MRYLALVCFLFASGFAPGVQAESPGTPVDIAAFARRQTSDGHLGLEWDEPRVVRRLEIVFARNAPDPPSVHVDTWVSNWPAKSAGGWTKTDTRWQGVWREVTAKSPAEETRFTSISNR